MDIPEKLGSIYLLLNAQSTPIDSLIDPAKATEAELENCVDEGIVGRYSGNIEIAG